MDNPTPNVGETITYTITLTDNGPDSATNVHVTDLLPSGLFFLDATATQGIYDPLTGLWTVGTVVTTVPQTLLIRAKVIGPGSTVNTATISHADQFDPDHSQQHRDDVGEPAAGRPLGDQDRERPHTQRGRYDRLYRHIDR